MPEQLTDQTHVEAQGRRDQLAAALARDMDMDTTDAREIASFVLAAFEGQEELDDRELDSDLRSVFYEIEEHKLLNFRRETYRNEDGHKRRAYYWTIRWDEVRPDEAADESSSESGNSVYEELPTDAWSRDQLA
ncbi:hypothetical protein BRD56_02845 [Thermoplasmatales archaeon SW_10_69_26]|nr:MAG: hypothetical protein BRD56_02845 [Thermoplasmatales archaeon SW_10_69_26]